MQKEKKIYSLQALRGLAFVAVFISHTSILNYSLTCLGAWGVSIFLVLSGFVLTYSYYKKNRIEKTSFADNLKFSISKLSNIYCLHIICTIAMSIFFFIGDNRQPYSTSLLKIVLNVLLIQEYVPISGRSINPVSWYLCVTALAYFIFPFFLQYMEKKYSTRKASWCICICIIMEFFFGILGSLMPTSAAYNGMFWDNDLCFWIAYYFPMSRVLDFIIGINLGYLYITKRNNSSRVVISAMELIGAVLSIVAICLFYIMTPKMGEQLIYSHPERWWTYSLVFLPGTTLLIYSFAFSNGAISNRITNRLTLFLAKISSSAFLIHYVVFRYLTIIYYRIPGYSGADFRNQIGCWINLTLGFVLTCLCVFLWNKIVAIFNDLLNSR